MRQLSRLFYLTFSLVALSSCGGAGKTSGNCDLGVVSDYNTFVFRCSAAFSATDKQQCRNSIQSFLSKYPGLNCTASRNNPNSVDSEEFQLNEDHIKSLLNRL